MKLIVVHQYLITAGIALAVIFGVRSVYMFWTKGEPFDILMAAASLFVGLTMSFYLRGVRAKVLADRGEAP